MFVIQDKETRNYLSQMSFQLADKEGMDWLYITYTGKLGTRFYATKKRAEEVLDILSVYNLESGANKKLHIINIDECNLPIGEQKIEYIFNKIMFKPVDFAV